MPNPGTNICGRVAGDRAGDDIDGCGAGDTQAAASARGISPGDGQAAKAHRDGCGLHDEHATRGGGGGGVLHDEQVSARTGDGDVRGEVDLTAGERDGVRDGIREVHRATGAVGEGDRIRANDAVGIQNGLTQRAGAAVRRGGDEEAVLGDGHRGVWRGSDDVAAGGDDVEAGGFSGFGSVRRLGEGGERHGGGELAVRDDEGACAGACGEGERAAGGQIEVRGRRGGAGGIQLEADGQIARAGSTGEGVEAGGTAFCRRGGGGGDADGIDDGAGELRGGGVVVASGILSGATGHIGRDGDAGAARREVEGVDGSGAGEVALRAACDGDVGEVETGDGLIKRHGDGDDGIRGGIARGAGDGDGRRGVIDGVGLVDSGSCAWEGVASGVSDVLSACEGEANRSIQAG